MTSIAPYAKAVTGAIVAGLSTLAMALQPTAEELAKNQTTGTVTGAEWVNIAIAFLTGLGLVWAMPNKDQKGEHQEESVQPPDAGYVGEHRDLDDEVDTWRDRA